MLPRPAAHVFMVAKIARREREDSRLNPRPCRQVQRIEPLAERADAVRGQIFADIEPSAVSHKIIISDKNAQLITAQRGRNGGRPRRGADSDQNSAAEWSGAALWTELLLFV